MVEINFQRIPTWVVVLMTAILIFGGLELAELLIDSTDEAELYVLQNAPMILFLGVGVLVYIFEAMLFTVIPIELTNKFLRSPWLGAFLGIVFYGPVYHWSNGAFSVFITIWIVLVLNSSYIILRQRSRRVAICSTIGLKIIFILYAALSIYSDVG